MTKALCPECDRSIKVPNRAGLRQRFVCPHCRTVAEVSGMRPLELDWAYDENGPEGSLEDVWDRKPCPV